MADDHELGGNAALVVAACLLLAACGGDDPGAILPDPDITPDDPQPIVEGVQPTATSLAGIWGVDIDGEATGLLVRFALDGTLAMDDQGLLDTRPSLVGTYEVGDGSIGLAAHASSDHCQDGERWEWAAGHPEDGQLDVVFTFSTDPTAGDCNVAIGTEWSLVRLSPWSSAAAQMSPGAPRGDGAPPSTGSALRGIWLLDGGGHLLRLGADGTFTLDGEGRLDTDPADSGTFEVDGEGRITLTSGPGSRVCEEDHAAVWEDTVFIGRTLQAQVAEDRCGEVEDDDLTWLRVSPV